MPRQWIENGPVSLPPPAVTFGAAAVLAAVAVAGVILGVQAASRPAGGPDLATAHADADTLTAQPLVDITPTAPTQTVADDKAASSSDADSSKAEDLAAQTAKAQALQAKPAASPGDIDSIMTSASEKPPAPVNGPPEDPPPAAPVKSDVPF